MKKQLCVLLSVLGLSCCSVNAYNADQFTNEIGEAAISSMIHAEHITAATVAPSRKPPFKLGTKVISLSTEDAKTLRGILINDGSYRFGMHKRCLFIPTLAYEFSNKPKLTVYVSPSCKQIQIDTDHKSTYLDYDPAAKELDPFNERIERKLTQEK